VHATKAGWFRRRCAQKRCIVQTSQVAAGKTFTHVQVSEQESTERLYVHLQATISDLKVSQLSGAMTNLIYRCRYQRGSKVRLRSPRHHALHLCCAV